MTFNTPSGPQASAAPQGENQGWAKVLEQLVRLLTGYTPMRFTPFYVLKKHGETEQNTPPRWRTILGLEEIQYLPEDVNDPDQNVSLGKTAHEIWHVLFSRPELIFEEPELIKNMAFQALWWAIEDPRVNIQGTKRHPGARDWLDAAMAKDYEIKNLPAEQKRWTEEIPLHLQFNYALIYEWWTGAPDPRVTDDRVKDALAKAADPIRRAYSTSDARKSFKIIRDEVWPIYKELVDESYQDQQQKQQGQDGEGDEQDQQNQDQQDQDSDSQSSSSSQKQGKPGKPQQKKQQKPVSKKVKEEMEKKEKEFRDKHASKMVDKPEKMSDKEKEAAKKDLERMRKKMGQKQDGEKQEGQEQQGEPQEGDGDQNGDKNESAEHKQAQRERLSKPDSREETDSTDEGKYKDYFSKVRHLVPVMKAQFQQVLRRKIRRRFVHDRKSGDLDEEAISEIPGGKRDVFEESMIANKTLYRVSLMIDVSGSMSGDKKEHSVLAAVMMMEALDKLPGVVYEIVRFDDKPQVVKSYNERTTQATKIAVVKALLKNGGSTQSDLAVKEAIQRIRMGRGDKLMMVINDGDPDNNFDRERYRQMVLAAKDIEIHGLGLGPEAQLVIDLFPKGRGWWLKDVTDCAKRIREILKKKFLGGQ
ncbi:MAG: VWA domain-containing protein [Elusimicrobia bacterium]|nr:VWA domain-containing protein [Elusimicrobiota bacterium]